MGSASVLGEGPLPDRVAGLRVVRALARDDRADILLLHTGSDTAVVAKVFHPAVRAEGDRELAATTRAASPHTVEVLDVSVDTDGRLAMVLPRLTRGPVGGWLAERDGITAGEAATVLAPIAETLETLHAAGIAHGRLGPGRVLLSAAGSPVLIGFGGADFFAPGSPEVVREGVAAVASDRTALRQFAAVVLPSIRGAAADRAGALLEHLVDVPDHRLPTELVDGLFAFTAGSPLSVVAPREGSASRGEGPPDRSTGPTKSAGRAIAATAPGRRAQRERRRGRGTRSRWHSLLEAGPAATVREGAATAWRRVPRGRRRMVVGLAAGIATVLLTAALVPGAGAAPGAEPGTGSTAGTRSAPDSSGGVRRPSPEAADAGDGASADSAGADAAITGDDPLAAARVLLAVRERALRDLDDRGLRAVDETGSPAAEQDGTVLDALREGEPGGTVAVAEFSPALTSRMGDAALIDLGPDADPASALLVRTEAGWRVRDWFAAVGSAG